MPFVWLPRHNKCRGTFALLLKSKPRALSNNNNKARHKQCRVKSIPYATGIFFAIKMCCLGRIESPWMMHYFNLYNEYCWWKQEVSFCRHASFWYCRICNIPISIFATLQYLIYCVIAAGPSSESLPADKSPQAWVHLKAAQLQPSAALASIFSVQRQKVRLKTRSKLLLENI